MNKNRWFVAVTALLLLFVLPAHAQTKVGYVDTEVILRELPEAQKALKELETLVTGWRIELAKMDTSFQKEVDDYQKKKGMMKQDAQDAREKELTDLRQKALQFNSQKFDNRQGEAVVEQNKRMGPIRDRILKAIESVAKEENVAFVFDRTNDAMLLFADAKFDITYRVIDRLKRGATPASKGK